MPKPLLWLGMLVGAVVVAWTTDVFHLIVRPSDVLDLTRPPVLATVLFNTGLPPHLAVAALPVTPRDRSVFQRGRFHEPAFLDLAARLGGAWLEEIDMRVVFEANRDSIRIMDVRVKEVAARKPVITRAFVEVPHERAARNPQLVVDLGSPRRFFASRQTPGQPFFGPNSLPLKRGEQAELSLEIKAGEYSHTFVLEVDYLAGGARQPQTFTVTDLADRPFRVTGVPADYTDFGTIYRNTGVGLQAVTGRAACELFRPVAACSPGG